MRCNVYGTLSLVPYVATYFGELGMYKVNTQDAAPTMKTLVFTQPAVGKKPSFFSCYYSVLRQK